MLLNFLQKEETVIILYVLDSILTKLQEATTFFQASDLKFFDALPKINEVLSYINNLVRNENYSLSLIDDAKKFFQNILAEISSKRTNQLLSKNKKKMKKETILFANITESMQDNIIDTFKNFAKELLLNIQIKFIDNDLNERKIFYKEVMLFSPKSLLNKDINYDAISLTTISLFTGIEESIILKQLKAISIGFKQFFEQKYCNNDGIETNLTNSLVLSISGNESFTDSNYSSESDDGTNICQNTDVKEHVMQWNYLREFLMTENNKNMCKELFDVYKYILTLPLTQNKCEGDFSKLKQVKNSSRSIISDRMLENVILIDLGRTNIPDNAHAEIINMIAKASDP